MISPTELDSLILTKIMELIDSNSPNYFKNDNFKLRFHINTDRKTRRYPHLVIEYSPKNSYYKRTIINIVDMDVTINNNVGDHQCVLRKSMSDPNMFEHIVGGAIKQIEKVCSFYD